MDEHLSHMSSDWVQLFPSYTTFFFLSKRDTLTKSDQRQQEEQNFLNTFRFHGVTHYSNTVFHRKKQILVAPFTERSENPREKQRKLQRPRKKVYF